MALTLAALLPFVNQITGRAETDLTDFLRNVIHNLERDSVFLEGREEVALSTGVDTYAMSGWTNEYKMPIHIQILDSDDNVYSELDEITYAEYRQKLTSTRSNSQPYNFAVFNGSVYLDIPPSASYDAMEVWGPIYHGDTVTTIQYDEKYRNLLVNGCAWEVFKRYGLTDKKKARDCKDLYESEKVRFMGRKANERHHFVKYND